MSSIIDHTILPPKLLRDHISESLYFPILIHLTETPLDEEVADIACSTAHQIPVHLVHLS